MTDWILLLAGSVLSGAALVAAFVLPSPASWLSLVAGAVALGLSLVALDGVIARYATLQAGLSGVFFILAGAGIGYRVAAAILPHLGRELTLPPRMPAALGSADAVVLLSHSDPERYSPSAIARRHRRLVDGAGIEVPATAVPFVFLAEKARYRSQHGRAPGAPQLRALAGCVRDALATAGRAMPVTVASADDAGALATAVAEHVKAGAARVSVVVLGNEDSDAVARAKSALSYARPGDAGVSVAFGPSLWHDTTLASRLAERILAPAHDQDLADVGVVLVCAGAPPEWEHNHAAARADENFFNQRVRMLLADAGLEERCVRIAWLDWQTPDVTEAVRHTAALGCTRIVVAPSTITTPSLDSAFELERAIEGARLPDSVRVVSLDPWADDSGFADAVVRSALAALGAPTGTPTP